MENGDWELMQKQSTGAVYGPRWKSYPQLAVTKAGLTLNELFCETFGFKDKDLICVFFNKKYPTKFGLQLATNEEEANAAYKLQSSGNSRTALYLGSKRIAKILSKYVGKSYDAKMTPGSRIIEINMS